MNARKTPRDYRHAAQEPRLERGVLAAGSFAVVPVADDAPSDAGVSVGFRDFRDCSDGVCEEVESLAANRFAAEGAFGTGEEVVGDVLEVPAVSVPWASGGDVVGCTFAWGLLSVRSSIGDTPRAKWLTSNFDQNGKIFSSTLMPGLERLEKLEAAAGWRNLDVNILAILRRRLIQRYAVLEMRREFFDIWRAESKLSAVVCWYRVF